MTVHVVGDEEDLAALFSARAVLFKRPQTIRFSSGILSPGAYNENRVLPSCPDAWEKIIRSMRDRAEDLAGEYNVIASIATGGIIHGGVIAYLLHMPHVTVRLTAKTGHGLGEHIDGNKDLLDGASVLIVEDMSSTYESTQTAIDIVESCGAEVTHTLAISTWGFPEFYANVAEREAHVLVTGDQLIEHAHVNGLIDGSYLGLLHDWIEDPRDESWADETWVLPKE